MCEEGYENYFWWPELDQPVIPALEPVNRFGRPFLEPVDVIDLRDEDDRSPTPKELAETRAMRQRLFDDMERAAARCDTCGFVGCLLDGDCRE